MTVPDPLIVMSAKELLSLPFENIPEVIGNKVLIERGSLMLAGPAGVGKSTLALEWAVRLSLGMDIWSLSVSQSRKVLMVQAELPPQAMKERLRGLLKGLNICNDPENLHFVNKGVDLSQNIHMLAKALAQSEAEVAVIDPLSSYHTLDENSNSEIRPFLDQLKKELPDISWIVVHHHGKPGDKGSNYRGASAIKDWFDNLLNLRGAKGKLKLEFEKLRYAIEPPNIPLNREGYLHLPETKGVWAAREALKDLGGTVQGQAKLVQAIRKKAKCSEKTAKTWIREAVSCGLMKESDSPDHKQKKTYTL